MICQMGYFTILIKYTELGDIVQLISHSVMGTSVTESWEDLFR